MADKSEEAAGDLGTQTPRQKSRSRSRTALSRIHSAPHVDDASVYHHYSHNIYRHGPDCSQSSHEYDSSTTEHENEEHETEADRVRAEDDEKDLDKGIEEEGEVRFGIADHRDIDLAEKGMKLERKQSSKSSKSKKEEDPNLVTWDGPDDPANPKNWSSKRKWAATFVVSSFTFISPVSSSMVAPALNAISAELDITSEVQAELVLSIFILAYAIAPLFVGPLSELYGRTRVLQLTNLIYLIFNAACGGAQTKGELIAFRFLSGLGGAAPLAIGGGVLSDIWKAEERGKSVSIYSLMPLLGPAIGPIAGGWIVERTTWRWAFYATSIADAVIQCFGLIFLQETYPPTLLGRKAAKLRKETGNQDLHTVYDKPDRTLTKHVASALVRPFKLLGTQPIVQFLAVYQAYLYGTMYLLLATFPTLFEVTYNESVGIAGLNYISLGLGFFLGAQVGARLSDKIYVRLKKRNNDVGRPEFRVPLIFVGALIVPIGLFIYAWTAQYGVQWIAPNIGACIFATGAIMCFQGCQTYIVDTYTLFAASAVGAAVVLRSLAGFGFPLFAPYMYAKLGYGWGNSLLGFLGIGIGIPAPIVLWMYGAKLRAKSTYAVGGGN